MMFVLHVNLEARPDTGPNLVSAYQDVFRPAVSAQLGFDHTLLLRSDQNPNSYRLVIAFQDEPSQKNWVSSSLHQEVWPKMEANCASYKVEAFHAP